MASPVPAKSQPLHNFDLPRTLGWSKDGKSTNHPQRRRSVKSPSRRPNPSPSPIRHESPLRDSSPAPESSRGGTGVIEYRRTHHHNHNQSNHNQASQFEKRRSSKILIKIHKSNKSEGEDEDKDNLDSNVAKLEQEVDEGSANRENLEQNDDQEKGENEKDEEAKTWNLRPRKPLRRSLNVNGVVKGNCSGVVEKGRAHSPKNPISRGGEGEGFEKERRKLSINVAGYGGGVEKEKRKLSINISLTKEEIEEDIFAFTGSKPARRPRKRSKAAQKHVDYVFPGLWLVGITPDSYKVSESSMKV